ncbi:MAG: hypothetical protein M9921_15790, partial [Fimbriimonadaceae bacterium]|nr:hypothetical protein [Fimbriimonadaceae bacterium]
GYGIEEAHGGWQATDEPPPLGLPSDARALGWRTILGEYPYHTFDPSRPCYEYYDPTRIRTLHRRFADIHSPDDAVTFANQFGLLGTYLYRVSGEDLMNDWYGEPLEYWLLEAQIMRDLLLINDTCRTGSDDDKVNLGAALARLENARRHCLLFTHLDTGTHRRQPVPQRAMATAIAMTNRILMELTTVFTTLIPGKQFSVQPLTLHGAIYLQFAQEAIGETRPPQKCPACGRWFTANHGRRKYCDDKCRQRAFRNPTRHRKTPAQHAATEHPTRT